MYSILHHCMELCTHLSSRNFHTTLVIPSISGTTTTHISSSFSQNPLISGPSMRPRSNPTRQQSALELQAYITTNHSQSQPPIICTIVNFQIGWTKEVFQKFNIPVVSFITFDACASAMELGSWINIAISRRCDLAFARSRRRSRSQSGAISPSIVPSIVISILRDLAFDRAVDPA